MKTKFGSHWKHWKLILKEAMEYKGCKGKHGTIEIKCQKWQAIVLPLHHCDRELKGNVLVLACGVKRFSPYGQWSSTHRSIREAEWEGSMIEGPLSLLFQLDPPGLWDDTTTFEQKPSSSICSLGKLLHRHIHSVLYQLQVLLNLVRTTILRMRKQ